MHANDKININFIPRHTVEQDDVEYLVAYHSDLQFDRVDVNVPDPT